MALRISGKDLGALALEGFCPRCFWIGRHFSTPYRGPFPGVFSNIDSYTKQAVQDYFDKHGRLPKWLAGVGDAAEIISVDRWGFKVQYGDITLTGVPDMVFRHRKAGFGVVDYKTARYTGTQDALMPMYTVQLNAYAYILEGIGRKPVVSLHLAYFEPPQREEYGSLLPSRTTDAGIEMPLGVSLHRVEVDTESIPRLLDRAAEIYRMPRPPKGAEGCEDCAKLDTMMAGLE